MANPLLDFWMRLLGQETDADRSTRARGRSGRRRRMPTASALQAEATIFLVLRRMRAPLIVLITIFAVSVLGLTLIPGQGAHRMSIFDAFYFMSYTASTIGFGELPEPFSAAQRLWVTAAIYLTVIGWAYAIGSVLALLQDRAFRQALALRHFSRKVKRLREPFLLIVGHGATGELLSTAFDELGRRVVVIDIDDDRIEALELGSYRADVPGLVGGRPRPRPPRRGRAGQPALRRRAGPDQRRRGQPDRHDDRGPPAAGPHRDRPHRLPCHRRTDGGVRRPGRGEPVRPVRRPPQHGHPRARVLPAGDLVGERAGRGAARAGPPARARPVGRRRLRPVRPRTDRRPARARGST